MIKRKLVWIDEKINFQEVKRKLMGFQNEMKLFDLNLVPSIHDAFELLKKIEFDMAFVVIIGKMSEEFIGKYQNDFRELNCICAIGIFCPSELGKYKNLPFINDRFLNSGGIFTTYDEVIKYLMLDECNWKELSNQPVNPNQSFNQKEFDFTLASVQNLEDIVQPILFGKSIKRELIKEENIKKFINFVMTNYNDINLKRWVKPSMEKNINIPLEILAKYYVYMYTYSSSFHSDMNRNLTHAESFPLYETYIYILYYSLKSGTFKPCGNRQIFRGTLLSKDEYKQILDCYNKKTNNAMNKSSLSQSLGPALQSKEPSTKIDASIYIANNFLSFSRDENVADYFLLHSEISDSTLKVKFIINPSSKYMGYFISNLELKSNSKFKDEKEILILPKSCFEIIHIEDTEPTRVIYLGYLDRYEKKMDKYLDYLTQAKKGKEFQFFYEEIFNEQNKTNFGDNLNLEVNSFLQKELLNKYEAINQKIKDLSSSSISQDIDDNKTKLLKLEMNYYSSELEEVKIENTPFGLPNNYLKQKYIGTFQNLKCGHHLPKTGYGYYCFKNKGHHYLFNGIWKEGKVYGFLWTDDDDFKKEEKSVTIVESHESFNKYFGVWIYDDEGNISFALSNIFNGEKKSGTMNYCMKKNGKQIFQGALKSAENSMINEKYYYMFFPSTEDLKNWIGIFVGPKNTPYEGGIFELSFIFPDDYPIKPPKVTFITPIFHCNIRQNGSIDLDILKEQWSPSLFGDEKILLSIISFLDDPNPDCIYFDENIIRCKLYKEDRKKYNEKVREWVRKYAK